MSDQGDPNVFTHGESVELWTLLEEIDARIDLDEKLPKEIYDRITMALFGLTYE